MKTKILKYLCYFDIFSHPLSKEELLKMCGGESAGFDLAVNELVDGSLCYETEGYYALSKEIEELVEQRKIKGAEAEKYLKKLPFYARLIRSFPFVKGIAISGSLSKSVMQDDGDIDYFIITTRGRLWICRTFLVGFKKIFLFNSKKYFCVNYFVDEDNLLIPDNNIFTAIEIASLFPVYNGDLLSDFRDENKWTNTYLSEFGQALGVKEVRGKSWIGRFIQFIFKGKLGDRFDLYLMKFTYRKWEKKFKHFDATKFELTMRTNRGVSKHHPRDFQNRVLTEYTERLEKMNIVE